MSERTLARHFQTETGLSPARYVERVRCEAARRLLEESDLAMATIAARVGLGSVETLRRSLKRSLGMTPQAYRQRAAGR